MPHRFIFKLENNLKWNGSANVKQD